MILTINKARYAFNTLKPIRISTTIPVRNKSRAVNADVTSALLYGSETWRVAKTSTTKLQSFTNRCLRNILNVRWPEAVPDRSKPHRDRDKKLIKGVDRSHTSKACIQHHKASPGVESTSKKKGRLLEADLAEKHQRRDKSCRYHIGRVIKAAGTTLAELKRASQNRARWRGVAAALCSTGNQEA
ncbi:hypothetical protein EGW08_004822 [Elysia chlorotica]|uniref:Uncharacterized protein n=1 Tax=Elysia chlorotica TaxID=188477 RepID=A0A3S1BMX2_ELYCH|nr:hypothetical protein EGW08_004822 [Elysia chlorotica]